MFGLAGWEEAKTRELLDKVMQEYDDPLLRSCIKVYVCRVSFALSDADSFMIEHLYRRESPAAKVPRRGAWKRHNERPLQIKKHPDDIYMPPLVSRAILSKNKSAKEEKGGKEITTKHAEKTLCHTAIQLLMPKRKRKDKV